MKHQLAATPSLLLYLPYYYKFIPILCFPYKCIEQHPSISGLILGLFVSTSKVILDFFAFILIESLFSCFFASLCLSLSFAHYHLFISFFLFFLYKLCVITIYLLFKLADILLVFSIAFVDLNICPWILGTV